MVKTISPAHACAPDSTNRLLRLPEVQHQTGLGRSAIYDKVKKGLFPAPIKLGERASAWVSTEVQGWIEQQIAASKATV